MGMGNREKNRNNRFQWNFAALVAAAVLLTGCGSGLPEAGPMETIQPFAMGSSQGMEENSGFGGGAAGQPPAADADRPASAEQPAVTPSTATAQSATTPPTATAQSATTPPTATAQSATTPPTATAQSVSTQPMAPAKPTSAPSPEITLVMVGDILFHTPVAESGWNGEAYDFSAVFAQVKEDVEDADLALVNQEVILGGAELGISGYPNFNAPYELGDALVDAGFDVILHATNHALDKGKQGVRNCLAFWQEKYPDVAVLGMHGSEAAQQEIYVYEQAGIRVAILNFTYGTNGIPLPEDMPYAVDLLERERVISDLRRAKELADFVIVCPHWGTEYVLEATKEQEEWAALFVQNGADLVLGTHPHVIEPIVWMREDGSTVGTKGSLDGSGISSRDKDKGANMGEQGTLIYYSLGNYVNWTSGTGAGVANRMVGGMAHVVIGLDEDGQAVIKSYGLEPLVCHVEQGFGGVTVYPLEEYTEELAAENEIVKQDSSFSLEYCKKLVRDVFGIE